MPGTVHVCCRGNGAAYCLQPGVSFTNQSATAQVVVELGEHDLNGIKMVTKLGTEQAGSRSLAQADVGW